VPESNLQPPEKRIGVGGNVVGAGVYRRGGGRKRIGNQERQICVTHKA
jgi:hypothetical protein